MNHDILVYFAIGMGIGLFFQLIHDIAIKFGGISEEELPDFTLEDHVRFVFTWPIILIGVVVRFFKQ